MKGIDICYRNGNIDFEQVKKDGYDFIIPRDGWGMDDIDPALKFTVKRARECGIEIPGVYHFIYGINEREAVENARKAIENVKLAGLPSSTVIWCDLEGDTFYNARDHRDHELTYQEAKSMTIAFCNHILAEGYPTGIYTNQDYMKNVYGEEILKDYDIWLADLEGEAGYPCVYRQYDWYGKIGSSSGIDLDEYYGQYTAGTARRKRMKASELLKQIHDVVDNISTVYEQGSEWGAWNGHAFRLDCIIFIKCMVYWGWYYPDKSAPHGGAKYDPNTDYTEGRLLAHCTSVGYSGFLSAKPCELLYMDGHCGFKIDEFTKNGRTYNVAECTVASAWGYPQKCIYSYVDDDGYRYEHRGGRSGGKWEAHGMLEAIDYDSGKHLNAEELADAIMSGYIDGIKIGNGEERIQTLMSLGYTREEIRKAQDIVNERMKKHLNAEELADAIIKGELDGVKIGNGDERIENLMKLGYTREEIRAAQDIVNERLSHLNAEQLADCIMSGYINGVKIGNEPERSEVLMSLGYTKEEIRAAQDIVNERKRT